MNGILLVDKESGMTSHDVVGILRKILKIKAIGHGGTLDPLATGLLCLLIGEATKLSSYVMAENKTYRVNVRFGIQTDSGDVTGKVIQEKKDLVPTCEKILEGIKKLTGVLSLPVPKYSAVKIAGRKLYEYAREGEDVEIPLKEMTILRADLLEVTHDGCVIELDCEKGTYVRSWVERLGELLGCFATVRELRRLKSGIFSSEAGVKVSTLKQMPPEEARLEVERRLISLPEIMAHWPALKVEGRDLALVQNGQIPRGIYGQLIHFRWERGIRLLTPTGNLLALAVKDVEKGVKLARVFPQTAGEQ